VRLSAPGRQHQQKEAADENHGREVDGLERIQLFRGWLLVLFLLLFGIHVAADDDWPTAPAVTMPRVYRIFTNRLFKNQTSCASRVCAATACAWF